MFTKFVKLFKSEKKCGKHLNLIKKKKTRSRHLQSKKFKQKIQMYFNDKKKHLYHLLVIREEEEKSFLHTHTELAALKNEPKTK